MLVTLRLDPQGLRRARLLAGLTQTALAAKVGVHPITLTRYETGAINPRPDTIKRISRALDCEIVEIATVNNEV